MGQIFQNMGHLGSRYIIPYGPKDPLLEMKCKGYNLGEKTCIFPREVLGSIGILYIPGTQMNPIDL